MGLALAVANGSWRGLFPVRQKNVDAPTSISEEAIPATGLWMRHSLNGLKAAHERLVLGAFKPWRLRLERVPLLTLSPVSGRPGPHRDIWLPVLSKSLNPSGSSDLNEKWIPPNFMAALHLLNAAPLLSEEMPLGAGKTLGPLYIEKRKTLTSEEADHWVINELPALETALYFSEPLKAIVRSLPPFDMMEPGVLAREMVDTLVRTFLNDHTEGFFGRHFTPRRLTLTEKNTLQLEVDRWTVPLWLRLATYLKNGEDDWDRVFEPKFCIR